MSGGIAGLQIHLSLSLYAIPDSKLLIIATRLAAIEFISASLSLSIVILKYS
jgi:hypothetical protein